MKADIGDTGVSVDWLLGRRLDVHLRMGAKACKLTRSTLDELPEPHLICVRPQVHRCGRGSGWVGFERSLKYVPMVSQIT